MKMNEGRKPAYINDLLKAFKVFFKYAYEENYTSVLLTEKIKGVKKSKIIIRGFDKKEIRRMLDCYEGNDFLNIRNKAILIVLFDCGIRLTELVELTETQIKDDYILIYDKGGKGLLLKHQLCLNGFKSTFVLVMLILITRKASKLCLFLNTVRDYLSV